MLSWLEEGSKLKIIRLNRRSVRWRGVIVFASQSQRPKTLVAGRMKNTGIRKKFINYDYFSSHFFFFSFGPSFFRALAINIHRESFSSPV